MTLYIFACLCLNTHLYNIFSFLLYICSFSQVDYFTYLGELNPVDCAAIYFKYAFENVEKITLQMTWHGTKNLTALKVSRFAHACEGKYKKMYISYKLLQIHFN